MSIVIRYIDYIQESIDKNAGIYNFFTKFNI